MVDLFGYVACDKKGIDKDEVNRYRMFYCGICHELRKYGNVERLCLNYDVTFLTILLSSLYEPQQTCAGFRCGVHPFRNQGVLSNEFISYGADMSIALAYYKCQDDWNDDKKSVSKRYASFIRNSFEIVRKKYPRQCQSIEACIDELNRVEKNKDTTADEAILLGGELLKELFVYREDFWSSALRDFGMSIGRFVYLMDATLDYKSDLKHNNYNPIIRMNKTPEQIDELLRIEIGQAVSIFEKLPLVSDLHLLRNVLYSGVWQQYDAAGLGHRYKMEKYK